MGSNYFFSAFIPARFPRLCHPNTSGMRFGWVSGGCSVAFGRRERRQITVWIRENPCKSNRCSYNPSGVMQPIVSYSFTSCYNGCRTHAGCNILQMSPLRCKASGNLMIWLCANDSWCFYCIIRVRKTANWHSPVQQDWNPMLPRKSVLIRLIRPIRVTIQSARKPRYSCSLECFVH